MIISKSAVDTDLMANRIDENELHSKDGFYTSRRAESPAVQTEAIKATDPTTKSTPHRGKMDWTSYVLAVANDSFYAYVVIGYLLIIAPFFAISFSSLEPLAYALMGLPFFYAVLLSSFGIASTLIAVVHLLKNRSGKFKPWLPEFLPGIKK